MIRTFIHIPKCLVWGRIFNLRLMIVLVMFSMLVSKKAHSQIADHFSYDEISVVLNVPRIGSVEIPAVIHGQTAYLPIKDLFDFLKIRNTLSADMDSVTGFFINPKATFVIDNLHSFITYQGIKYQLKPNDLVKTETALYLTAEYFYSVFELDCSFSFRNLAIKLTTKIELPAIREMQQEQMRRNISQLKGEKKVDTTIKSKFAAFRFGMVDWAVAATQKDNSRNVVRMNVGVGAFILGGEANVYLNYSSNQPFNKREQFYKWRFVNNSSAVLRQVTAGKIYAQGASSILDPITGFQLTNTPTTYKKSFGSYTLSNNTKPGWMVELYVNNVLVNYTKADASGFFTFEVPMVYGNSLVKLRFYGPWGEEEEREQNINIPYNFVPAGQLEYTLTGGVVEDDYKSRFSRGNLSFGVTRRLTVSGGVEYLSSLKGQKSMPFTNVSFRLGSNMLFSAEHILGIRSKGNFNYRLPSNLQFDLSYTKYNELQTAIRYSYSEEKRAVITMPIKGHNYAGISRLTLNQYTLQNAKNAPNAKTTAAEFLLSGMFKGISTNLTTNAIFSGVTDPSVRSNLSVTFRLPGRLRFTPQAQYDYSIKNFNLFRCEVERPVFKSAYLNLSYAHEVANKTSMFSLGFRYNFSFAQTFVSATHSANSTLVTQSARGSLMYNGAIKALQTSDQNNVGRGALIILPFLDLNCNGRKDANEPKAFGLNLRVNSGRIERHNADTSIRVVGLEAFNKCIIELDKASFENVTWQIRKPTLSVDVEANNFQVIEIPVAVMGEVSGTVNLEQNGLSGIGRIIVNIYDTNMKVIARTLSEGDGYFSYMGLAPGEYTASVDQSQLSNLKMKSSQSLSFKIKLLKEGDVADGLVFSLQKLGTKK